MAETTDDTEKTEDPSQKRLDEAIEHGDVAKSQEVNTWFVTAASALVVMSFSAGAAGELRTLFGNLPGQRLSGALRRACARRPVRPSRRPGHRRGRHSDPAPRARGDLRQHGPAPAGVVARRADAEALAHFARG